ncbi:ATP-binding protein [Aliarcobacter lanthieri]|uniref:ATP-binding protein n=1 Tax=Aliarcobacter lanthieri TaxID=1355374 RepID=UPI00047B0CF8|nr:ATP-binding protein [Aliarcobacter lanthieri]
MKLLEENYEINFSKINFLERKEKIVEAKTIISGANKTGKSYLIYDFLSNFKSEEYLYIDFLDLRNAYIKDELFFLQEFIDKKNIKALVLENIEDSIILPNCQNIIISSLKNIKIDGFSNLSLSALDFEEYLLFDNKHQNITQSFNSFLKYGNLAELINIEENKKNQRLQEILKLSVKDSVDYDILKILIENIDEKKSIFQLFNSLKNRIKISKDRFYETCKYFEESNTIYFIPKYNQEKSLKKIYSYNHAFLSALSFTKKFKNEFTNMIFLELLKEKDIYYLDNIDFYIKSKNLFVVAIPFFNSNLNTNLLKKIIKTAIELEVRKVEIVTVSNRDSLRNSNIQIDILPFYEWAVI